jgi:hypothetical protein
MPMIHSFKLLIVIFTVLISVESRSQTNKPETVYFLADTTNTSKENRLLEIGTEAKLFSYYTFYCKCAPPFFMYPTFMYRNDRVKPKLSDVKPEVSYMSWKQLSDSLHKYGNNFPEHFKLVIVEILPSRKYKIVEALRYVHQNKEKLQ